jgi:hypothetical protein
MKRPDERVKRLRIPTPRSPLLRLAYMPTGLSKAVVRPVSDKIV